MSDELQFVAFFVSIRVEIKSVNDKLKEPLTKCLRRYASKVFDQSFLKFVGHLFYRDLSSSFISGVSRLSFVKRLTPVSITFGGVWPLSLATIALTDS